MSTTDSTLMQDMYDSNGVYHDGHEDSSNSEDEVNDSLPLPAPRKCLQRSVTPFATGGQFGSAGTISNIGLLARTNCKSNCCIPIFRMLKPI